MKVGIIIGHKEESQGAYNKNIGLSEYKYNSVIAQCIKESIKLYKKPLELRLVDCNNLGLFCNGIFNSFNITMDDTTLKRITESELYDVKKYDCIEVIVIERETYKNLPKKVNDLNLDFAISLHCNAFNTKATGTETLYYHSSKNGKVLAEIFQKNIVNCLNLKNRGIKAKFSEDRGGYLLRYTAMPVIILEPFFIDNDDDLIQSLKKSSDFIETIIKSIYEYINYISI